MAFSGFSGLEMAINMPASLILVAWVMMLGFFLWRRVIVETIKPTLP
jgi:hypothetical protein